MCQQILHVRPLVKIGAQYHEIDRKRIRPFFYWIFSGNKYQKYPTIRTKCYFKSSGENDGFESFPPLFKILYWHFVIYSSLNWIRLALICCCVLGCAGTPKHRTPMFSEEVQPPTLLIYNCFF